MKHHKVKQHIAQSVWVFIGLVLFSVFAQAQSNGSAQTIDADKALAKLKKARPDFQFGAIQTSEVPGFLKTSVINGPTIYVSADGNYFFAGGLYEVTDTRIVDLAEKAMEERRVTELAKLKKEDMVVFGSPESNKAAVYVFTDVDCYYCQKLHLEVAGINQLGIEVRYLAFPRKGLDSAGYRKITSAWCAEDPNAALTALKAGKQIPEDVCQGNPVGEQYRLGSLLGVRGTPAIMTEDGRLLPGYMPAAKLAEQLGL